MLSKNLKIIIVIILIILSGIVVYYIFHHSMLNTQNINNIIISNNSNSATINENLPNGITFRAKIYDIATGTPSVVNPTAITTIWVQDLESNNINYINKVSKYHFELKDTTILEWNGKKINASDFKVGHTVSVTYTGVVGESYPAVIFNVLKIELLDDDV